MGAVYLANAATQRFLSLPVERKHLLLGLWDHGACNNVSPFRTAELPEFQRMGAHLRFFDQYLKGEEVGFGEEAPVHYFTMVEEQRKAAASWPAPEAEPHRYYFADGGTLSRQIPDPASASDTYRADFAIGTGAQTLTNGQPPSELRPIMPIGMAGTRECSPIRLRRYPEILR